LLNSFHHYASFLHFTAISGITEHLPQADESMLPFTSNEGSAKSISSASKSQASSTVSKQQSRQLLGELCVDKDYLEKLLKHPGILEDIVEVILKDSDNVI
jgi:hypothetical protein